MKFAFVLLLCFLSCGVFAQLSLVKDINTKANAQYSTDFMDSDIIAGKLFFSARVNNRNCIGISDGTKAGTSILYTATLSSGGYPFAAALGNVMIFSGYTPSVGHHLWKTDGTEAGTSRVSNTERYGASAPWGYTKINETLFFSANDYDYGWELWKTDGTEAGTGQIKDLNPGRESANPAGLTAVGATLFFRAETPNEGTELWRSDGTEQGTVLVKDIAPGQEASTPNNFTPLGSSVIFTAYSPDAGVELWRSDGTEAGTYRLTDIVQGPEGSYPQDLTVIHDVLYFRAQQSTGSTTLWKTDGTSAGTVMIREWPSYIHHLTPLGNGRGLAFMVNRTLWKTDGTINGTVSVKDIPGTTSFSDMVFKSYNGGIFMAFDDGEHGMELWRSDGTANNTFMIRDVAPGATAGYSGGLNVLHNTTAVFYGYTAETGRELWRSDGTSAGTVIVADLTPSITYASNPSGLTRLDNTLYFYATDGDYGTELWKTDGTEKNTILIKDIERNAGSSDPRYLTTFNNKLYFFAYTAANGRELWMSDGTNRGTEIVKDMVPGPGSNNPIELIRGGDAMYFSAAGQDNIRELWRSDGTAAGTRKVASLGDPNVNMVYDGSNLFYLDGKIYMTVYTNQTGTELWVSDGTTAGTRLVKDIEPGYDTSFPEEFTAVGNILYFKAFTKAYGEEIWKSDGTAQGTTIVKDIAVGPGRTELITNLTSYNGYLYFHHKNTAVDRRFELWKSDGTDAGTVKIKELDREDLQVHPMYPMNNDLYFLTGNGRLVSLWRSNGTDTGTTRITTIDVNVDGYYFDPIVSVVGNVLTFIVYDDLKTSEMWVTDGTADNTRLYATGLRPANAPIALNDGLYFAGDQFDHNVELWRAPLANITATEDPTENQIEIYPNPVTHTLNVILPTHPAPFHITLYSTNGTVLDDWTTSDPHFTIDTTSWPPALYLLRIQNPTQPPTSSQTHKILKR